jgi:hypothetical protein
MPKITKLPIKHRLYNNAGRIVPPLCADAPDGQVIAFLGPTQAGKSIILSKVISCLEIAFPRDTPGAIPVVSLKIETVNEGRAKPKWLGIMLLKLLQHPMYKHIGTFEENERYTPSKGRDEGTIRIALNEAFTYRSTRRTCLDEAHLLTHAKDPDLRAHILESVKSACAIDRTLIICGGYELAYRGLFDSSHFAGRTIVYDFGSYGDNPVDLLEWIRISKTVSKYLDLKPESLLVDQARYTLIVANGTFGLLEKWLWNCRVHANAFGRPIDLELLKTCAPPIEEQKTIREDIRKGAKALSNMSVISTGAHAKDGRTEDAGNASKPEQATKPFTRKPNRAAPATIELNDDA